MRRLSDALEAATSEAAVATARAQASGNREAAVVKELAAARLQVGA